MKCKREIAAIHSFLTVIMMYVRTRRFKVKAVNISNSPLPSVCRQSLPIPIQNACRLNPCNDLS